MGSLTALRLDAKIKSPLLTFNLNEEFTQVHADFYNFNCWDHNLTAEQKQTVEVRCLSSTNASLNVTQIC